MKCGAAVAIRGSLADVVAVSRPVERWPLLLPAYRRARIMGRYGDSTVLQMRVRRGPLLVGWTAEQMPMPDDARLVYRHVRGLATGMWSEWRFVAEGDRVRVTVTHEWRPSWPVVGPLLAALVCRLIMTPITRQTLAGLRRLVESGQAAALRRLEAASGATPGPSAGQAPDGGAGG